MLQGKILSYLLVFFIFSFKAHANGDELVTGKQFSEIYSFSEYAFTKVACRDLTRSYNYLANDGKALIVEDELFYPFYVYYIDGLAKFLIDEHDSAKGIPQNGKESTLTASLVNKTINGCYNTNRMDEPYLESLLDVLAEGFDTNILSSKQVMEDFSCRDYADKVGPVIPILMENSEATLSIEDGINALKLAAFITGYHSLSPMGNLVFEVFDTCKLHNNRISFMEALNKIRKNEKK